MSYEEAISTIKQAITEVEWNYPMDYAVALDMAIEVLEFKKNLVERENTLLSSDSIEELEKYIASLKTTYVIEHYNELPIKAKLSDLSVEGLLGVYTILANKELRNFEVTSK